MKHDFFNKSKRVVIIVNMVLISFLLVA